MKIPLQYPRLYVLNTKCFMLDILIGRLDIMIGKKLSKVQCATTVLQLPLTEYDMNHWTFVTIAILVALLLTNTSS